MARAIVYTGAIAQSSDVLGAYRNPMIALGHALEAIFGPTGPYFDGLACTPSVTPMSVDIAPGSVIEMSVVDASDYGDLPADFSPLVKIGVNVDATTFALSAPPSVGESVIWTIAGAFAEADSVPVVLPYYRPDNPTIPYSGPGNSGIAQNTVRDETVNLQVYEGAPSATPVAPGVAAGYTPLWHITIPFGATVLLSNMITVDPAAPFLKLRLPQAAGLDSPQFTGLPTAPTPVTNDNSTLLSTTAFTHAAIAAALVSPHFTGIPTAPTPDEGDSSTTLATTAFTHAVAAALPVVTARTAAYEFPVVGAVATNAGAKLDGWLDARADFGCMFDAVTDDTANFMRFWTAIVNLGIEGRMPSGTAKLSGSQVILDIGNAATRGVRLVGEGGQSTVLDVSACTSSPQMFVVSGTTTDAFYSTFRDFAVKGNAAGGITFQIGREYNAVTNTYPDAFNLFDIDLVVNNNSATARAAARLNYVVNSDIELTCNCSGAGVGSALQVGGVCFSNLYGSYGNANIGLEFTPGYSFGNSWFGIDIEVVNTCIVSNSLNLSASTFHGGQFVWNAANPPVVLNQCGGQVLFIGGNFGTAAPTVGGAQAEHACMVGFPVGSLALGGMNIITAANDAAVVLSAPASYSAVTAHQRAGVTRFSVGTDPADVWHVERYPPGGGISDRPFSIDPNTGTVTVTTLELNKLGINGRTPIVAPTLVGQRTVGGAGAQVDPVQFAALLTALDNYGLVVNSTTN